LARVIPSLGNNKISCVWHMQRRSRGSAVIGTFSLSGFPFSSSSSSQCSTTVFHKHGVELRPSSRRCEIVRLLLNLISSKWLNKNILHIDLGTSRLCILVQEHGKELFDLVQLCKKRNTARQTVLTAVPNEWNELCLLKCCLACFLLFLFYWHSTEE